MLARLRRTARARTALFAMAANRLDDPTVLAGQAEAIEQEVFLRTADLFQLDVDLIFYDTTTAWFAVDEEDEYGGPAASGADLVALEVVDVLSLRRRVVLPSPPERFRATSVVDRPGDFGPAFDRVIADLAGTPDLVVLSEAEAGDAPYAAANRAILDQAVALAGDPGEVLAVIVWEGRSRGAGDLTKYFADEARAGGSRWSKSRRCEAGRRGVEP